MHKHSRARILPGLLAAITFCAIMSSHSQALAQNPELPEKLAAIKQSSAANKQALAHYTWLEQQTISLKGEVKKTEQFQVRIGPDGQQQKAIQSIQVASYLSDPGDAVTIAVQFAKLPDGTNHVATIQVNGVSKQLGVAIQNSTYQSI